MENEAQTDQMVQYMMFVMQRVQCGKNYPPKSAIQGTKI